MAFLICIAELPSLILITLYLNVPQGDPIIAAGGPCAYNAEPLADVVDLVFLGEGEEQIGRASCRERV